MPIETEVAGDDTGRPRRVVGGGADGGTGREDPPRPSEMNQLVRELAYDAQIARARQGR